MRFISMLAACTAALALASTGLRAEESPAPALHIDVPVVLKTAKVAFNMDHLAFNADEPIGLMYMSLMVKKLHDDGTNWQLVAVFHGAAGYMLLDDAAYNRVRKSTHGNPYKQEIAALTKAGVQFEECGQTAKVNHWGNADLLPGVKVNSGANFRLVQLVQDGFTILHP